MASSNGRQYYDSYGDPLTQVATPRADEISTNDEMEAVRAQFPLFPHRWKNDYLAYRACSFSVREACMLAGVGETAVRKARREDPLFAQWEGKSLPTLQSHVADKLLKAKFTRNMMFVMSIDGAALRKLAIYPDKLSDIEYEWAKTAANRYKANDLAMMLKALEPDPEGEDGRQAPVNIVFQVGDTVVNDPDTRRAAKREMLEKFKANARVIEGQSRLLKEASADEQGDGWS